MHKMLGSLPVAAEISRRIGIAAIIDEACPVEDRAQLTHGEVIEVLIANRLSNPSSMVRVEQWAREWAVEEVYGVPPAWLNDDRIARALDAIAPYTEMITGSVGAAAIAAFGIDVTRMHWDLTSISLYGSYDDVDPAFPVPGYGHPKDRRTDLKQIQAGMAVTADGGIPVWHRAYDGGAGEIAQVVAAVEQLRTLAKPPDLLLVGDSKLISYGNVRAMTTANVHFVAPLGAARVPPDLYASLDPAQATLVNYVPRRDRGKPADQIGTYRVVEHEPMALTGRRRTDPVQYVRRVLVHSSALATAAVKNRHHKLARATTDLNKLVRTAGSRYYPTHADVAAKLETLATKHRVRAYLDTTITTTPAGTPALTWYFNQDALTAEAATDGWYTLVTNQPTTASPADVLTEYKNQPIVERRYSNAKGPLAVAPLFLQHNRRITALLTVICLALLIYCLIEREVRKNLGPDTTMHGFYPDNRKVPPTAQLILNTLNRIQLIPTAHGPPRVIPPNPLQARLLTLLNVDPTRPRWTE